MSQQEFFQQPERRRRQKQNSEAASSYYRKPGSAPKEEHPSTFEDAVPPYAYRAQDTRHSSSQTAQDMQARQQRPADGATSGRGYRPGTQYQMYRRAWQGPRRQQRWQNILVRWAIIILLIFVLMHVLPFLVSVLLVILGVLAVALLLPIFIIFGVIATVVIITLIALKMLGIPIRWSWLRSRLLRH
jgi:Flp pilus assembly protein TadB